MNPLIKTERDQKQLWCEGVRDDRDTYSEDDQSHASKLILQAGIYGSDRFNIRLCDTRNSDVCVEHI